MQLRTKLWIKPALTGLVAVLWIEASLYFGSRWTFEPPFKIDRDVLLSLLQILGTSMLTVAIFAVSAMVAAYSAVATTATPRASRLVMQDQSSQNALSAFLSAFIYAIVGLVSLSAMPYGELGRFVLFVGYVVIVAWVLVSFIRWVDQVSRLGRVQDTIRRIEEACLGAFMDPATSGNLGAGEGRPGDAAGWPLSTREIGYIQFIDVNKLQQLAEEMGCNISVHVRPGAFVDRSRPLAFLGGVTALKEEMRERLLTAFNVGEVRHAESDPRFGLVILAEVADRALSPGINDPGTAIEVIGSLTRLLTSWADASAETTEIRFDRVKVPPLDAEDLMEDAFNPIIRDGSAMFEVSIRLQKAFQALHALGHPALSQAVRLYSGMASQLALEKLHSEHHRKKIREIAMPG